MRSKALLLATTATAIRPTTRRAALGAVLTPTAAVAYDSKNYDRYAGSYDDLDGGQAAKALGIAAARKALAARCAGRVLEVGAYEGGSTTFFQRYLLAHERSSLLAVDTWRDTSDPESYAADGSAAAAPGAATLDRFRRNVAAAANARKVTALRGDSATVLARLVDQRRKFDFVYVDGSHRASEVLVDVALAWQLLRSDGGGVMLLDDYGFKALPGAPRLDPADAATGEMACAARAREARELTTGEAIEAVLASVPGGAEVLYCGYQLLVRKRRGERDASDDIPVRIH